MSRWVIVFACDRHAVVCRFAFVFFAILSAGIVDACPPQRISTEHLPNAIQIHEKVISGGLPKGDEAFVELAELGVKTIISVDGMKPDVETARKHGLRYVHLPHGYDGIPLQRGNELAKAVKELAGPVYVHCHHGKHRSPAAASVACIHAGLIPARQGLSILKLAGTDPKYRGLYESVERASKLDPHLLSRLPVQFPETQPISMMADAMVSLEHAFAQFKRIAENDWKPPSDHPDLDPAHQALLIRELCTELIRSDECQDYPDDFQNWIKDSESAASELEGELNRWQARPAQSKPPSTVTDLLARMKSNCNACHARYRDVPLSQKKRPTSSPR